MRAGVPADMTCVTFLIFLASLAVLERIVRRPLPNDHKQDATEATDSLRQLGAALESYGRGQQPQNRETDTAALCEDSKK